jgi:mannose-6-phosphate isomerase
MATSGMLCYCLQLCTPLKMYIADNVVRAGLTPKLRDVPTLTSMLTYTYGPSDQQLMSPKPFRAPSKHTTEYNPPIEEFSVLLIDTMSAGEEKHPALAGPSILIVTELNGQGKLKFGKDGETIDIKEAGQTFFVAAGTEIAFEGKMIAYRAFVEVEEGSKL